MHSSDIHMILRFFVALLGAILFFGAIGAFIVRLLIAGCGLFLVWMSLRPYFIYRLRRW